MCNLNKNLKGSDIMGTFIVLLILIAIVFLAIRKIYKDKKSGKTCASCSGGCDCGCGHCHDVIEKNN